MHEQALDRHGAHQRSCRCRLHTGARPCCRCLQTCGPQRSGNLHAQAHISRSITMVVHCRCCMLSKHTRLDCLNRQLLWDPQPPMPQNPDTKQAWLQIPLPPCHLKPRCHYCAAHLHLCLHDFYVRTVLLRDLLQLGRDGLVPLVKDVHVRLEHHDVGARLHVPTLERHMSQVLACACHQMASAFNRLPRPIPASKTHSGVQ